MITGTAAMPHPRGDDDDADAPLFDWAAAHRPPPPPGGGGGSIPPEGEPFANRQEQIFAAFKQFHADNPEIWRLFVKNTFQLIDAGHKVYGVAAIIEQIRWHYATTTVTKDPIKIRNDFRAYYARMFNVCYQPFFKVRILRSQQRPPNDSDEVWIDPAPDPVREWQILTELSELGKL